MRTEIDTAMAQAFAALERARLCLATEISGYPTPVSGCDAQFNHLLAQRAQVGRAIDALGGQVFIATPRSPSPVAGVESR